VSNAVSAEHHAARVEIDGVHLAYRLDGPNDHAPVVVLLHSLGTDLRMWEAQARPLARSFRVLRYDCRGHGVSDVAAEPVTVERLGRDVLALLDHLAIARAHLCGVSLGGLTALWLAVHAPERVDRVVLANTGARVGSVESWEARIQAVERGGMPAIRDAVLARWVGQEFRVAHPDVARMLGQMLDHTPVEGYVAACRALRDADLRAEAHAVRVPTLIVAGERDESTPPALSEALHAAIPGSVLEILPAAAHLSNVERPEEFTALVERFLSGA
jgi:3-oxoadipate enol-lactonase